MEASTHFRDCNLFIIVHTHIEGSPCPDCWERPSAMPSTVLLNLLRVSRSAATRQAFLNVRASSENPAQVTSWLFCLNNTQGRASLILHISSQVSGASLKVVGVRWASRSLRFESDQPVTWDSFGIWDNRIEEPVLLPSSIRYGKPIPRVSN